MKCCYDSTPGILNSIILFANVFFNNKATGSSFIPNSTLSRFGSIQLYSDTNKSEQYVEKQGTRRYFSKQQGSNTILRLSSSSSSPSSSSSSKSITITIPKFLTDQTTPIHQNTYPSPLHKIHIQQILTKEEASQCLQIAKDHAEKTLCWSKKDSDRHSSYATADFPIDSCDEFISYLDDIDFDSRIWSILSEKYDIDVDDLSFLDFFCAHYESKKDDLIDDNGGGIMDRLDPHRDGSLLSFTIVLSDSESYVGGGTIFDALRDVNPNDHPEYEGVMCENGVVRVKNSGDGVLHSGKLKHGGNVVTKGERTVLVGFVDVDERCMRDGVLKEACKEWGRGDVVENRLKRQLKMTTKADDDDENNDYNLASGWYRNDNIFVKKGSMMRNFVPAFPSVKIRGKAENQRLKNLKAEDTLLRDILLPREDRQGAEIPEHILAAFGGDISLL